MNWPGNDPYEPSPNAIFKYIANDELRKERFDQSVDMLKSSCFLFGEMEGDSKESKEFRKEAEGKILRFFYDHYYKDVDKIRDGRLLGRISRNPTDRLVFEHKIEIDFLQKVIDFYKDKNNYKFPIG